MVAWEKRTGIVTMGGHPVTLVGHPLRVGDVAPDFKVVDNHMVTTGWEAFKGKVVIIASVPSLDTAVCDTETRRFNKEAASLKDVTVLTISMDLPFAQARWCGAAGIDRVITLSDYRDASFGTSYGVLIEEVRLLARAVFVVDAGGVIRYAEIVPEVGQEPDYDAALAAARALTG